MNKKTILVSAYSCEPFRGSEPGVAWDYIEEMSKYNNLIVITRNDKKHILEKYENDTIKFIYLKVPFISKKYKFGPLAYIHYYLWQYFAYKYLKKEFDLNKIDIIHHITFVNSWLPSFLVNLNKPFIWGPIGEHPSIPIDYLKKVGNKILIREKLRDYFRNIPTKIDPYYKITVKKATEIITIDMNTAKRFDRKTHSIPAISLNLENFNKNNNISIIDDNIFRIYWCGNVVYWKGIHLVIDSFIKFQSDKTNVELIIIGDGKEKNNVMNKSKKYRNIKFLNNLKQEELFNTISNYDLFFYPSFEGGGMVVLEAMALGKPTLCLDYGGPGMMINNNSGTLIKYSKYNNVIEEFVEKLNIYYKDPYLLKKHGRNARNRVEQEFTIQKKIHKINKLITGVLNK